MARPSTKQRYPFECSAAGLLSQALLAMRSVTGNPRWEQHFTVAPEHHFHPQRKWRFDVAVPELKIGMEYQGGAFLAKGAHNTVKGIRRDNEKFIAAQLLGWMVLPFGPDETREGRALSTMVDAFRIRLNRLAK